MLRCVPPVWLCMLLLLCCLCQCVQEVDVSLPATPPKLVAMCTFHPQNYFQVQVGLSKGLTPSTDTIRPDSVVVTVGEVGLPSQVLRWRTTRDGRTIWESSYKPRPNIPYILTVRSPRWGIVRAESTAPSISPVSTGIDYSQMHSDTLIGGKIVTRIPVVVEMPQAPQGNRYFAFNVRQERMTYKILEGRWFVDDVRASQARFTADGRTTSLLVNINDELVLVDANYWNDTRRTLTLFVNLEYSPPMERPTKIFLEWRTLSEEFYKYYLSVSRQGKNLPLFEPDAVYSNVEGGYGSFAGYGMEFDTLVLKM